MDPKYAEGWFHVAEGYALRKKYPEKIKVESNTLYTPKKQTCSTEKADRSSRSFGTRLEIRCNA